MESPEIVVSLGYLWTALDCTLAESPKNRLIVHTIRYLNGFELLNIKAISNVIVKFAFHSSEPREKKDSVGVIRAIYTCFRDRVASVYHILFETIIGGTVKNQFC